MGGEFPAAVATAKTVMFVDIAACKLHISHGELIVTTQSDHIGDSDSERRCGDKTGPGGAHHLRQLAPIIKIVCAVFLVNNAGMVQVDQRKRPLPRGDMDGVEVTVEHQNIG